MIVPAPAQLDWVAWLDTVFKATIVLSALILLLAPASRPPLFGLAVPPSFAVIVELVIATVLATHRVHALRMAPAPAAAVLPVIVELSMVVCAVCADASLYNAPA